MAKFLRAQARQQSVGDRLRLDGRRPPARLPTAVGIVRAAGFRGPDLDSRLERFRAHRRAAQQSATTDRCDNQAQTWCVLEQLEGGGPLPGNDPVIVVGVHQRGAGLRHDPRRGSLAIGQRRLAERNLAGKSPHGLHFLRRAVEGMTMYAGMPRRAAARDRAAAWLPEECVTTPCRASSSDKENTALQAPRDLNAPASCRFSHFRYSSAPNVSSSLATRTTGVRRM